ncbi:hypothetical protein ACFVWG_23865 [Kribbella sp. NPDC058245]|uniref:hypothetical protein n=1 Tax=Kribbella sp. NPDC058245 TaxID=3346399 RepID=UPI0036E32459
MSAPADAVNVRTNSPVSVKFNIGGQAMAVIEGSSLYEDPDTYDRSNLATRQASEALRAAEVRKLGRGTTYLVETTQAAAMVIMDYCRTSGEIFRGSDVLAIKRDGDALLVVADRIAGRLTEMSS